MFACAAEPSDVLPITVPEMAAWALQQSRTWDACYRDMQSGAALFGWLLQVHKPIMERLVGYSADGRGDLGDSAGTT